MVKWIESVITLDLLYFKYYFYDLLAHPWLPFIKISHEMIVEKNNQLSVHTKRGDCFKKGLCRGGRKLWYLYGTVYTCTCTGTYWYQNPWYRYHFIYIIFFHYFPIFTFTKFIFCNIYSMFNDNCIILNKKLRFSLIKWTIDQQFSHKTSRLSTFLITIIHNINNLL